MRPPTDEEKALAERMVDAAIERLNLADEALRNEIRESLLDDLLCSPDGRRRLREAMPDVAPGRSGDVDRSGAASVDEFIRKRGRLG